MHSWVIATMSLKIFFNMRHSSVSYSYCINGGPRRWPGGHFGKAAANPKGKVHAISTSLDSSTEVPLRHAKFASSIVCALSQNCHHPCLGFSFSSFWTASLGKIRGRTRSKTFRRVLCEGFSVPYHSRSIYHSFSLVDEKVSALKQSPPSVGTVLL